MISKYIEENNEVAGVGKNKDNVAGRQLDFDVLRCRLQINQAKVRLKFATLVVSELDEE